MYITSVTKSTHPTERDHVDCAVHRPPSRHHHLHTYQIFRSSPIDFPAHWPPTLASASTRPASEHPSASAAAPAPWYNVTQGQPRYLSLPTTQTNPLQSLPLPPFPGRGVARCITGPCLEILRACRPIDSQQACMPIMIDSRCRLSLVLLYLVEKA